MNTGTNGIDAFPLDKLFPPLHSLPLLFKVLLLLGLSGFVALALFTEQYLIAGGFVGVVVVGALMVMNPRLWLYGAILLWTVWFRSSDKEVSLLDVGMVGYYMGGLIAWFIGMVISRRKLIRNFADQLILIFFSLGVVNFVIAWLNGVELLLWLRESLLFAFLLYYFPIRELICTRKYLIQFMSLAALVIFVLGITNLRMYIEAAGNAVYAFNILSSRVSLNETIFLGAALCSTVFLLYSRRWHHKVFFLGLTIFYSMVLIASFTRGAWLTFIIGLGVIFFLVNRQKRLALGAYIGVGIVCFVLAISLFLGGMSDFIFRSIESRFSSSAKGTGDISVNARVVESEAAIEGIYKHPLSGAGMGARVTFYDIIDRWTSSPTFLHNGYIFITYKLGIPMALFFLLGLLLYQTKGVVAAYRIRDPLYQCIAIGATASLLAALIISLTSNQFILRHGLALIAVYIALIAIVDNLWQEQLQIGALTLPGSNSKSPADTVPLL